MRQSFFPGTEPPDVVSVAAIDDAIDSWNDAKRERREAADAVKIKHATMLELLKEHKLERYPYTDPKTGKRRQIRIKAEPKIVSERETTRTTDDDDRDEPPPDGTVEMRRVSRADVEAEIGPSDPFAATRKSLEEPSKQSLGESLKASIAEPPPPTRGRGKKGK